MMAQRTLPFQHEEERRESGMTALAGLPVYLDLAHVVGLGREPGLERRRAVSSLTSAFRYLEAGFVIAKTPRVC